MIASGQGGKVIPDLVGLDLSKSELLSTTKNL